MLIQVYGREPPELEVKLFVKEFDTVALAQLQQQQQQQNSSSSAAATAAAELSRPIPSSQGFIMSRPAPKPTKLTNVPSAEVTLEQFKEMIPRVRAALAEQSKTATEYVSNKDYRSRRFKESRMMFDPQQKYRTPATTSQELGWHVPLPHERVETHPRRNCAETLYASEMIKSGQFY